MTEQEKMEKLINGLKCRSERYKSYHCQTCEYGFFDGIIWCCNIPSMCEDALALLKAQEPITGETSDGYHTFNELYHHRAVLFSVIVANYKDRAWKSVRHHDGTMYDGMFIVGIDTPDGQATYHYDVDPYWDMFDCKVREFAPEWDGHTQAQAIERIGKLKAREPVEPKHEDDRQISPLRCGNCGAFILVTNDYKAKYCFECGRAVRWTANGGRANDTE